MALQIVEASAACDLFSLAAQTIGRMDRTPGEPLYVIVPEQSTLLTERLLVDALNLPGLLDIEVLSPRRLTQRLWAEIGGGLSLISDSGQAMLLRRALEEAPPTGVYRDVYRDPAFLTRLCAQITQFKRGSVMPGALRSAAVDQPALTRRKWNELADCYERYQAGLSEHWLDGQDQHMRVVRALERSPFMRTTKAVVVGFEQFNLPWRQRLLALLRVCSDVTVLIATENHPRFQAVHDSLRMLEADARAAGIATTRRRETLPRARARMLTHLSQGLFAPKPSVYQEDLPPDDDDELQALHIQAASSLFDEAELAAATCVLLAQQHGFRWQDMAIVAEQPELYQPLLERAFARHGVPVFVDGRKSITTHPLVRYVMCALQFLLLGLQTPHLVALLKTGLCKLSPQEGDELENYAFSRGVTGWKWLRPFSFGKNAAEMEGLREKVLAPLLTIKDRLDGCADGASFATLCFELMERAELFNRLNQDTASLDIQVWNLLLEALDEMHSLLGGAPIAPREALRILETGLAAMKAGILPPASDAVSIGAPGHLKAQVKALLCLGVVQQPAAALPGLLDEEEHARLSKLLDADIGPGADMLKALQELDLMMLLLRPSQVLYLSYPLSTADGAQHPAPIIARLLRLFPGLAIHGALSEKTRKRLIATARGSLPHLSGALRRQADGIPLPDAFAAYAAALKDTAEWQTLYQRLIPPRFDALSKELTGALYTSKLSASRIERFAQCPFSHFAHYGLGVRELRAFLVQRLDIGNALHEALALFTKMLVDEDIAFESLTRELCEAMMENVYESIKITYENTAFFDTARGQRLWQRAVLTAKRAAWMLVRQLKRSGFRPIGAELGFGQDSALPALPLLLSDGRVLYIEGRIDRLDVWAADDADYYRIIDYKKSGKDFEPETVYHGMELQLLLYLQAALSLRSTSKTQPAGAFYFRLELPPLDEKAGEDAETQITKALRLHGIALEDVRIFDAMDSDYLTKEVIGLEERTGKLRGDATLTLAQVKAFNGLLDYATATATALMQRAYDGEVAPSPAQRQWAQRQTPCSYCEFLPACMQDVYLQKPRKLYPPDKDWLDALTPTAAKED